MRNGRYTSRQLRQWGRCSLGIPKTCGYATSGLRCTNCPRTRKCGRHTEYTEDPLPSPPRPQKKPLPPPEEHHFKRACLNSLWYHYKYVRKQLMMNDEDLVRWRKSYLLQVFTITLDKVLMFFPDPVAACSNPFRPFDPGSVTDTFVLEHAAARVRFDKAMFVLQRLLNANDVVLTRPEMRIVLSQWNTLSVMGSFYVFRFHKASVVGARSDEFPVSKYSVEMETRAHATMRGMIDDHAFFKRKLIDRLDLRKQAAAAATTAA